MNETLEMIKIMLHQENIKEFRSAENSMLMHLHRSAL